MSMIYHIAYAADWIAAKEAGEYHQSTRGRTLEEQGFIHAGTASQVEPVANWVYKDPEGDLVILVIDTDRVISEIKYDPVPGFVDPLPHIYGPLNADAVVEVRPFEPDVDGKFSFTE